MQEEKGTARAPVRKLFRDNIERWGCMLIVVAGAISSLLTFQLLDGYPYNSGKNLIGVFIPPFLTVLYLTCQGFRTRLNCLHLIKALILYGLQILPFVPLFFQVFQPTPADDFGRYYLYARNMIDNTTLWGGDSLIFTQYGRHYISQPGYRYFVLLELLLFRDLYRVVAFINIGLYIIVVFLFQKLIRQTVTGKKLQAGMLVLVLLFTPYAVKNLLMGLPEWLTVLLLMLASYLYIAAQRVPAAVFIMGLVPFFRQNLLIAVLLLASWMLWHNAGRVRLLFLFLVPLCLPLYHNVYYAGEWRFLVDIHRMPFLSYSNAGSRVRGVDFSLIFSNLLHYAGFDMESGKPVFSFIAVLFLPLSVIVYWYMIGDIPTIRWKMFFIVITMSAAVPVIFLGTAYYPRFEWVNVGVCLVTYLMLGAHLPFKSMQRFTAQEPLPN